MNVGPEGKDGWADTDDVDYDNLGDFNGEGRGAVIERRIKE